MLIFFKHLIDCVWLLFVVVMWVIKFSTQQEIQKFGKSNLTEGSLSVCMKFKFNEILLLPQIYGKNHICAKLSLKEKSQKYLSQWISFGAVRFVLRHSAQQNEKIEKKEETTKGFMLIRANNFTSWGVNETSDDKNLFHVSQ